MIITLENINSIQKRISVVHKARIIGTDPPMYTLLRELKIELSNYLVITIPEGFEWDLSSVPKRLWSIFPPDGDFELGALIHDYLYVTKKTSRKFADEEMLKWSNLLNNGETVLNRKRLDNYARFLAVRLFGADNIKKIFIKKQ